MDKPGEPSFNESLPKLCHLSDIFLRAKDVTWAADEPQVQAWKFVTDKNNTGILKRWSAERVAGCGTQVGAELRAAAVFEAVLDEPSPLMALLLQQSAYPKGSTLSVYPYAGPSADKMLSTSWAQLTQQEREPLCQKLAISGLKVFEIMENVPAEYGGPKLHRDGKLSNWCFKGDYFVCIDFGGFCSASLADWHAIVSTNYLDSCFCRPTGGTGFGSSPAVRVIRDTEEWRRHTTRSLDIYLLALSIVELYLGHLPDAIDFDQYYGLEDYLAAVHDYQWRDCVELAHELAHAPPQMMDFLLWCMDANPAKRPSSAAEALQHAWLFNQVAAVEQAVADAAPAWTETINGLREALAECRAAPAQTADPDDSSDAGSSGSSEGSSSGQLWSTKGSSGSSSTSSITSSECYSDGSDAACQQQDPSAPVDCSSASSNSTDASNCSLADCRIIISSEQLTPDYSISGGGGMVCTIPWAATDTGGDQGAGPGKLLLPPPPVCSSRGSDSSGAAATADRRPQQQQYPQQTGTRDVLVSFSPLVLPPSLVCSSRGSDRSGAAATANRRPQQQQYQQQTSTRDVLVSFSPLVLPPSLVCSSRGSDRSGAAATANRRPQQQQYQQQTSTRDVLVSFSPLVLPPSLVCSSRGSDRSGAAATANRQPQQQQYPQQTSTRDVLVSFSPLVLPPPLVCISSAAVTPRSHPLEVHRSRHSGNPCKRALRHVVHNIGCVGSGSAAL